MNFLIAFGICSVPKVSKYIMLLYRNYTLTYKTIQLVPLDLNSQDLLHMPHSLF